MPVVKDISALGGGAGLLAGRAIHGARSLEACASGHMGDFLTDPGGNVLKKLDKHEQRAYEALPQDDPLVPFVACYRGPRCVQGHDGTFLCLENLLGGFRAPHIMDCKLGVRTYLEEEVRKTELRENLYKKLIKVDPSLLTPDEQRDKKMTKVRYMTCREQLSSTSTLGFRIDGVVHPLSGGGWEKSDNLALLREAPDVQRRFEAFVERAVGGHGDKYIKAVGAIVERLTHLNEALKRSEFFAKHEFIGTSLLFVIDTSGKVDVRVIDLAKVRKCEEGLRHNIPWELGNREDGFLMGLAAMTRLWRESERSAEVRAASMIVSEEADAVGGGSCSNLLVALPVLIAAVFWAVSHAQGTA
eukprot:Hpha_TRINITY_DN19355_c0_g1::TRINITY_DN19355_c0_g1_i1::g.81102::m.81102/K00911/ITPK; 1D-myo-inositol-triphosphate 3-kinase